MGSYFGFPSEVTEKDHREEWLEAYPDKSPPKHPVLCERHYHPSQIDDTRCDTNKFRKRGDLKRKKLKPGAVPHIWPGWPAYCSKKTPVERSPTTSSDKRKKKGEEMERRKSIEVKENDRVYSLEDIDSKFFPMIFPSSKERTR